MKKTIKTLLAIISIISACNTFAADNSFKYIKPLALKYADSIGCADVTIDPKLVSKFTDKTNDIDDAYIAIVNSDADCMGGSGTSSGMIVILKKANGREGIEDPKFDYLKVVPSLSEPIAVSNSPTRSLTSIYQKNGQLFATGAEYGANDSNCCPSIKTIYKISLTKKIISLSKEDNRSIYTWNYEKVKNY